MANSAYARIAKKSDEGDALMNPFNNENQKINSEKNLEEFFKQIFGNMHVSDRTEEQKKIALEIWMASLNRITSLANNELESLMKDNRIDTLDIVNYFRSLALSITENAIINTARALNKTILQESAFYYNEISDVLDGKFGDKGDRSLTRANKDTK